MSSLQSLCRKTRMCRFYMAGLCGRGEDCSFAHGSTELRSAPDLHCTKICPALIRSGCCPDKDCAFAHHASELRQPRGLNEHFDSQPRRTPPTLPAEAFSRSREYVPPMEPWSSLLGANAAGALKTPGMQLAMHASLSSPLDEVQSGFAPPGVPATLGQDCAAGGTLLWVPWLVPPGQEGEVLRELTAKAIPASVECRSQDFGSRHEQGAETLSMGWKSPPAYVGGVASRSQQSTCGSDELDSSLEQKAVQEESPPAKSLQRNKFHKTRLCTFFDKGSCHKGTRCNFAHGAAELQPLPDLHCTKLCPRLLASGSCIDESCTYAHTKEELRSYSRELGQTRHVSFIDDFDGKAPTPDTMPSDRDMQGQDADCPEDKEDSCSLSSGDLEPSMEGNAGWGRQCTEDPSLAAVRMLRVKNTFLDVEEDETVAAPPLRRSSSAPCLTSFTFETRLPSKEQPKRLVRGL